jgi:hypothetical protein
MHEASENGGMPERRGACRYDPVRTAIDIIVKSEDADILTDLTRTWDPRSFAGTALLLNLQRGKKRTPSSKPERGRDRQRTPPHPHLPCYARKTPSLLIFSTTRGSKSSCRSICISTIFHCHQGTLQHSTAFLFA